MTNGEQLISDFPYIKIKGQDEVFTTIQIGTTGTETPILVYTDWWNAEYNEPIIRDNGVKNELNRVKNELDPTTKNEAKYCDRNICLKNEYNNIGCEDCEVTKSQEPTTNNDLGVDGCIHKCIDKPTEDCISREQAIEWVDNLRKMDECFGNHKGDYYPLSEVIDRLQNVPSVIPQLSSGLDKNSKKLEKDFGELDCISRSDAIRVASGYCHPSNVAKELAKLPSVISQEPKTGHWLAKSFHEVYCDNCGFDFDIMTNEFIDKMKYCPNCGADMREVKE